MEFLQSFFFCLSHCRSRCIYASKTEKNETKRKICSLIYVVLRFVVAFQRRLNSEHWTGTWNTHTHTHIVYTIFHRYKGSVNTIDTAWKESENRVVMTGSATLQLNRYWHTANVHKLLHRAKVRELDFAHVVKCVRQWLQNLVWIKTNERMNERASEQAAMQKLVSIHYIVRGNDVSANTNTASITSRLK